MPTYDRLPEPIGRVRAYDAGNAAPFMDRYLVLFEDHPTIDYAGNDQERPVPYGPRLSLAMSEHPQDPQGVGIMDYARPPETWGTRPGEVRWRRVPFASLPDDVRRCVLDRFAEDPTDGR